jgi:hypothetical protein
MRARFRLESDHLDGCGRILAEENIYSSSSLILNTKSEVFKNVNIHICGLIDCNTVYSATRLPTFRRNILLVKPNLKTEAINLSETLEITYQTTWCNDPEDRNAFYSI